jgi:hypothetical protein
MNSSSNGKDVEEVDAILGDLKRMISLLKTEKYTEGAGVTQNEDPKTIFSLRTEKNVTAGDVQNGNLTRTY